MRETGYRGKKIKTGEWINGNYIQSFNSYDETRKNWIICAGHKGGILLVYDRYEVQEKTIGQYSGLKDKFGRWIYEGDILRNEKGDTIKCVFEVDDCHSIFTLVDETHPTRMYCNIPYYFEIIGNIHENPELLK